MKNSSSKLDKLLNEEQELLKNINENHKESKRILSNNRQIRKRLMVVRSEILEIISPQIEEGKTLYQIVKAELGVVDNRYNKIYDLVTRTGKMTLGN